MESEPNRNLQMAMIIAEAVACGGGTAYYVGGFVRDRRMGIESKDVDLEIHGITPELLCAVLDSLGERTVMGTSFGVYGLRHYDLDIAMPRTEHATGRGHRDFEVDVDPFLGPEKAAARRDFTINAMMENVLTGELLDPFHGSDDIRAGIIRHVTPDTCADDPLRILRAAQFASRFSFRIAEETILLSHRTSLAALPRERVYAELEKAMCKGKTPSVFFEGLRLMKGLKEWFPDAARTAEDPARWSEALAFLDRAGACRQDARDPLSLMMAAFTLAFAPKEDGISSLSVLTDNKHLLSAVKNLRASTLSVPSFAAASERPDEIAVLFDRSVCPEDALLLSFAYNRFPETTLRTLQGQLSSFRECMALPQVTGRDLLLAGIPEGAVLGKALAYAHTLHLKGIPKEQALADTVSRFRDSDPQNGGAE